MTPATGSTEPPVVNIVGNLVALGPLRRDLLRLYQRWINDFAAVRTLALPPQPMTLEAEAAWYDGLVTDGTRLFTIYERATWRPIGNTDLRDVDHRNRSASFGILIGEADARGKGYGTETTRLVLDYAFTVLGVHNVWLDTASYNVAALRAYARAGFKEIGRRREAHRLGDRVYDVVLMDCLATEFVPPAGRALPLP